MNTISPANYPMGPDGLTYHLNTKEGDLAACCLLVGKPARAEMIAREFLTEAEPKGGGMDNPRGMPSFTGKYKGLAVSVITTGMGGPSTGIALPEAFASGAGIFIRVGSCGSLIEESDTGDVIIVNAACRLDGASRSWAPKWFPAVSDHHVLAALENAARELMPERYHIGIEATTDCFNEGQARPNIDDWIPPGMKKRHKHLIRLGVACYSMEASAVFTWCQTHAGGLPAGTINAVYAHRGSKNKFETIGDEQATEIALEAFLQLVEVPAIQRSLVKTAELRAP